MLKGHNKPLPWYLRAWKSPASLHIPDTVHLSYPEQVGGERHLPAPLRYTNNLGLIPKTPDLWLILISLGPCSPHLCWTSISLTIPPADLRPCTVPWVPWPPPLYHTPQTMFWFPAPWLTPATQLNPEDLILVSPWNPWHLTPTPDIAPVPDSPLPETQTLQIPHPALWPRPCPFPCKPQTLTTPRALSPPPPPPLQTADPFPYLSSRSLPPSPSTPEDSGPCTSPWIHPTQVRVGSTVCLFFHEREREAWWIWVLLDWT